MEEAAKKLPHSKYGGMSGGSTLKKLTAVASPELQYIWWREGGLTWRSGPFIKPWSEVIDHLVIVPCHEERLAAQQ